MASLYPKLATLVQDEDSITLALNEEYVPMGEVWKIKDGDTVALIPPISGGWEMSWWVHMVVTQIECTGL